MRKIGDTVVERVLAQSARSIAAGRPRRAPTAPPIRVFIVAAQHLVRLGLATLFAKARYCQVVGEAEAAAEALQGVRSAAPDVVVVDGDLDTARRLLEDAEAPTVAVVLLAGAIDPALIAEAIHLGVRGFLVKDAPGDRIVEAVEIVAADGSYFSAVASAAVQEWLRSGQPGTDPIERLSDQERRIVLLIAEGKTNRTIAATLGLSEYTVKTYVSSALRKLGFRSRAQVAAAIARTRTDD